MEIRRSYDRLISTMGFPILVRCHLYIESGPIPGMLTLLVLKPEYSGITRSIPLLLMPWFLAPPGHHKAWYPIEWTGIMFLVFHEQSLHPPIARFMGPTWGPSGADRTQVGPMLAPWTLLSGIYMQHLRVDICQKIWIHFLCLLK